MLQGKKGKNNPCKNLKILPRKNNSNLNLIRHFSRFQIIPKILFKTFEKKWSEERIATRKKAKEKAKFE